MTQLDDKINIHLNHPKETSNPYTNITNVNQPSNLVDEFLQENQQYLNQKGMTPGDDDSELPSEYGDEEDCDGNSN